MSLVHWTRFSWDLTRFSPVYPAIDSCYHIRPALAADEKGVRSMVYSAFTLDADWNFHLREVREELDAALDNLFSDKATEKAGRACLVVTHGSRIIGASVVTARPDAESHLLTGPCILMEYRNRGLGTALLGESLAVLRDSGLKTAWGLTQENSPTAEFLYPKFGSVRPPFHGAPDRAAG